MNKSIGLDIGGTKIAGALFDDKGAELAQIVEPSPKTYDAFLDVCRDIVSRLEKNSGKAHFIGAGICGFMDRETGLLKGSPNLRCVLDKPVEADLQKILGCMVRVENDAVCAALAEAMEGAGKGYKTVFGLILGTGVGGGYIFDGHVIAGANGMSGEIGHLPLPSYEAADGAWPKCGCGLEGCAEMFVSGAGLARLYEAATNKKADAKEIGALAGQGDAAAKKVLDKYFTLVAKAMVTILQSFDPDIITVSGGLNALPGLYEEVPKRWGKYGICKKPRTKFVPAKFGALAGLRGAALLGKI
ncbi:MAG: ROK family protein [Bdellovibrionales bacterium]